MSRGNAIYIRTLVKLAHGALPLHGKLAVRKLPVRLVRLDVVPRIVGEDVVALLEESRAELKGIRSLFGIQTRVCSWFSEGLEDFCGYAVGGWVSGGGIGDGHVGLEVRHAVGELFTLSSMVVREGSVHACGGGCLVGVGLLYFREFGQDKKKHANCASSLSIKLRGMDKPKWGIPKTSP